jgi:hypothetical protein
MFLPNTRNHCRDADVDEKRLEGYASYEDGWGND